MIYLLHISDLHLFWDANWNNMSAAILNNVEKTLETVPVEDRLLVVTGDFHHYSVAGYDRAKDFLKKLIDKMSLNPANDIFLIPGNHDVSPSAKEDVDRKNAIGLIPYDPTAFGRSCVRLQSNSYYQEYLTFVKELGIYSEDEVTCGLPIQTHVRIWRNRLHLLHLNTTLVADGESKSNQFTDTETATSVVNEEPLSHGMFPSLCLGHNSFYDINETQRDQLAAAFANGYISAYLSGDRHLRNIKREEKEIILGERLGTIPNIVCYRSSTDMGDNYSDFGMIWHLIDENRWIADLKYFRWDKYDQVELRSDGEGSYVIRHNPTINPSPGSPSPVTGGSEGSRKHYWANTDGILDLSKKELKPAHIKRFLLGKNSGRMYWNLIASDQIVRREIVTTLLGCIDEPGIYVLTGAGGEGKTTALMQLGWELIQKGKNVFFSIGYKPLPFPDISSIQRGSFFLLDNALSSSQCLHLLEEIQKLVENADVSFVLAARENEWNLMESDTSDYRTYFCSLVKKIPMGTVTKEEAHRFAECIKKNLHTPRDESQIQKIFQENSYGFLYASMLLSVSEKNTLDEIASEIISYLEQKSFDAFLILAFTVMSEHCGAEIDQELFKKLCMQYDFSERRIRSFLSKELVENAGKYQTRHPAISNLFYREVPEHLSQSEMDGVIQALVLLRLELYNQLTGSLRWSFWNGIKAVMQTVSLASSNLQEYIIHRLLDDTKSNSPTDFALLYNTAGSRATQSIFIRLCYERDRLNAQNLKSWTQQELKEQPWDYRIPYSAAWIYRGVYAKISVGGTAVHHFWLDWAAFEKQQRGLGSYTQENSTRWIFWKACMEHDADSNAWIAWGRLEAENGNVGEYDKEYSARWIFRKACMEHDSESQTWLAWGKLEAENGNVGEYDKEYSARWIFRKACMEHDADSNTWLAWGKLEAENGNVGEYDQAYSARWIFREASVNRNSLNHSIWSAWGRLEAESGNVGEYDQENSARWIISTGIRRKLKNSPYLISTLAKLELRNGSVENARHVLQTNYLNHGIVCGMFAIFTLICGSGENGPSLEDVLARLKNQQENSLPAINYLYHCYLLQGEDASAKKTLESLSNHNKNQALFERKYNNYIDDFIALCRFAIEGKPITDAERRIDIFLVEEEIES